MKGDLAEKRQASLQSQQYLQSALRTLGKLEEEHMVIVIVRDSA